MNRSMIACAFAGLATTASAQSLRVTLSFDQTAIQIGSTATATLYAEFTGQPAGAYLSSINIDLIADYQTVEVLNISAIAWNNTALGFDGQATASGADILGIEAAQFSLIPPITAGSPILITTFTVRGVAEGPSGYPELPTYTARIANDAPFAFSVTGGGFADPVVAYGVEAFVPAPAGFGLLIGGLALGARRRRAA